ncbi:MAG TPA: nucleoside deaminase [Candidatus Nanopelagicales bacterium]|nr:nucleoside deaminase [Candidatus Nanopelagicales bacterium]
MITGPMARALALAREARSAGDHPFGAVLELDGEVVAEARNLVATNRDITAHAETELVRVLEREGRLDRLARGTVHASCEPCPQCVGAMFWAGARHIVFGLSAARLIELSTAPGGPAYGFTITAAALGAATTAPMRIDGPVCEDEAAEAHRGFWF